MDQRYLCDTCGSLCSSQGRTVFGQVEAVNGGERSEEDQCTIVVRPTSPPPGKKKLKLWQYTFHRVLSVREISPPFLPLSFIEVEPRRNRKPAILAKLERYVKKFRSHAPHRTFPTHVSQTRSFPSPSRRFQTSIASPT